MRAARALAGLSLALADLGPTPGSLDSATSFPARLVPAEASSSIVTTRSRRGGSKFSPGPQPQKPLPAFKGPSASEVRAWAWGCAGATTRERAAWKPPLSPPAGFLRIAKSGGEKSSPASAISALNGAPVSRTTVLNKATSKTSKMTRSRLQREHLPAFTKEPHPSLACFDPDLARLWVRYLAS